MTKLNTIKTYKTAFSAMSIAFIIYVAVSLVAIIGLGYFVLSNSQSGFNSVWIVDPKSQAVMRADRVDMTNNPQREFEYRNHISMFYKDWFEFDQYSYKPNLKKGLDLLGNCGKDMLNKYEADNLGGKLAEYNMKATVEIDSILIDMNRNPVEAACFAKQTFSSPGGKHVRYVNARFKLFDLTSRSNENPHGVLIDNFDLFNVTKVEENVQQ